MNNVTNLIEMRHAIDAIDLKLQELLNARARAAQAIGDCKKQQQRQRYRQQSPPHRDKNCYVPEREAMVLRNVVKRNCGPLSNDAVRKIYQQIIAACRRLEVADKLRVAVLGPLGTFSHEAALQLFDDEIELLPCASIKEVLQTVERGKGDFCVVPIENSCEGVVTATLDCLPQCGLSICNELLLPVHHYLLSHAERLQDITQVYSHPQALAQCQQWLEKHLPLAAVFPAKSSAQACMLAASEANTAAIAGALALSESAPQTPQTSQYPLNVLAQHIEDEPDNTTRFYVMGKSPTNSTNGQDKTSLLINVSHAVGSLVVALNCFARHQVNLTLIQSRPQKFLKLPHQSFEQTSTAMRDEAIPLLAARKAPWEYIFFVEFEGHQQDRNVSQVLDDLRRERVAVKVLGSFPRVVL